MIQSRIREIRKARGLTLQQVAERIGTTAQTIGRLETGMRTLSIDWVERIAGALEADPSELLAMPEGGDIEVSGQISAGGVVAMGRGGVIVPRMIAKSPVAFRVAENMGQYRAGDVVVCDTLDPDQHDKAEGRDCYIVPASGKGMFGRVIKCHANRRVDTAPISSGVGSADTHEAQSLALATMLIRAL